MNKAIAHILKTQLADLTFIDKLAGLIYMAEYQDTSYPEDGTVPVTIVKRIPLSCDVDPANCDKNDLEPDASKKGILYFEDGGLTATGRQRRYSSYTSKLRIVCWLNTDWFKNDPCVSLSTLVMNDIIERMRAIRLKNISPFVAMTVTIDAIPKQDKTIFSQYTYDSFNTGYLLPPFEYFAIDLSITFLLPPSCLGDISIKTLEEFNNTQTCAP